MYKPANPVNARTRARTQWTRLRRIIAARAPATVNTAKMANDKLTSPGTSPFSSAFVLRSSTVAFSCVYRQQILLHYGRLHHEMQCTTLLICEPIGPLFQLVRLHEAAAKQEVRDNNQDCANKPSNSSGRHEMPDGGDKQVE